MTDQKHRRARDDRGASAVEYALLIAGIAAVIALVAYTLGGLTMETYQDTCTEYEKMSTVSGSCGP